MMLRRLWPLAVVVIATTVSCGSDPRSDGRHSLVQQLEAGGLDQNTAECVVDAFFHDKTNDELKGFFDRPQLTPEEAAEFAALGQKCKSQS